MRSGWRGGYIRAFVAMIGIALIFAGVISSQFLGEGFSVGSLFTAVGLILLGIAAYLWYKDFQQKG